MRDRKRAERGGHLAELAALWAMRCKGYRLLASRYKTPMGEIDLIMRRGNVTCFIEVKKRASDDAAIFSVSLPASEAHRCRGAQLDCPRPEGRAGKLAL